MRFEADDVEMPELSSSKRSSGKSASNKRLSGKLSFRALRSELGTEKTEMFSNYTSSFKEQILF